MKYGAVLAETVGQEKFSQQLPLSFGTRAILCIIIL